MATTPIFTDKEIGQHSFTFNRHDNGGEALSLKTQIFYNGCPDEHNNGVYLNQDLTLMSYCNSATFNLIGAPLTPELLRELADSLEDAIQQSLANMD